MTITLTREEAQQVLDALQCATPPTFSAKIVEDWQSAVELLRARLAQPEPEPVAWADKYDLDREGHDFWVSRQANVRTGVPLYIAPPQREWQSLTDEEMFNCLAQTDGEAKRLPLGFKWFAEAIEAKLKEKNSA